MKTENIKKLLLLTASGAAYLVFSKTVISFFVSDYLHSKGKEYLYDGYISKASDLVESSINLNPNETLYHRTLATTLIAGTISSELNPKDKETLKKRALKELNTAYKLQPYNVVNVKSLIPMYYFLSVSDISDPKNAALDEEFKKSAISFYKKIQGISPNDASIYLTLGKHYKLLKENETAKSLLEKALTLKPDLIEAQEELNLLNK